MSSVKLRGVTARNFLSYGNQDQYVDLSYQGTTLVLGNNKDTGGHNAVGKTTILEAICYALYGKTLAKIKKTKIKNNINKNKNDSMEVSLELEINDNIYEIVRGIGTDVDLAIYKDKDYSNPITPDSIANTNKFIEDLIGLSYELFRITVVFLGSDNSFFEMGQGKQRDLLSELFKILTLNDKAEILKEIIKNSNEDLKVTEAVIKQQENAKAKRDTQVLDAEQRITNWEGQKVSEIDRLTKCIDNVDEVNAEEQEEFFEGINHFESDIINLNSAHNDLVSKIINKKEEIRLKFAPDIEELQLQKEEKSDEYNPIIEDLETSKAGIKNISANMDNDIKAMKSENDRAEKDICTSQDAIKKLEEEITHLEENKCPYCKQKYNDVLGKIEESHNAVKVLQEGNIEFNKIISNNVDGINALTNNINEIEIEVKGLEVKIAEKIEELFVLIFFLC